MDYLNKEQLRDLFRELGLADRIVQDYYATHTTLQYADSLLHAWINERDYVLTKGGATWENLMTALQRFGCNGAANEIDGRKYLLSGDGAPSNTMSTVQTLRTGQLSKQPYNILYLLSFSTYPLPAFNYYDLNLVDVYRFPLARFCCICCIYSY